MAMLTQFSAPPIAPQKAITIIFMRDAAFYAQSADLRLKKSFRECLSRVVQPFLSSLLVLALSYPRFLCNRDDAGLQPASNVFDKAFVIRYSWYKVDEYMQRETIIRILNEQQQTLAERYSVKTLFLFGSVARGEARDDSDVDLLVEFSQPVGLFQFIELQQWLESLLGCKVDLGTPRSLKISIKDQVLLEAIRVA